MAALNKQTKELISMLHNTDEVSRRVVYLGIGFSIAQMEFATAAPYRKNSDHKLRIVNIISTINELAVIDYDTLKHLVTTMVDYKLSCIGDNTRSVVSANSVNDVFNTGRYFSEADLQSIDKNLATFKSSVSTFTKWYMYNYED